MSKAPDLSAFPIPRKGGARPIEIDEDPQLGGPVSQRAGEGTDASIQPALIVARAQKPAPPAPKASPARAPVAKQVPVPATSGSTVATTVKLDEDRYLRLAEAGRPGPGRLKRRTIQDMVIEALDEWFEKRGL